MINILKIEPFNELDNVNSEFVKCPSCGRGRLCDKIQGVKIISCDLTMSNLNCSRIIVKCPKCSKKFSICIC